MKLIFIAKRKNYKIKGERGYDKVVKDESSHTGIWKTRSDRAIEMEM